MLAAPERTSMTEQRQDVVPPDVDDRFPVPVRGQQVDSQTRCVHWDDTVDVIALRFACCEVYYPCYECHEAVADHEAEQWPVSRFDEPAVLCGVCNETISARQYLAGENRCPHCGADFNPGCKSHRELYFETE